MRFIESTTKIWMVIIDPYYQRQKCRPITLVSGDMRYIRDIRAGSSRRGVKWQWGCPRRHFSAFSVATSLENLKIRPRRALLNGATENASPVKCSTMKMTDQIAALEFARPGKWQTKSHPWNLQDLENEGPNRRGWKMQDQFDLKK